MYSKSYIKPLKTRDRKEKFTLDLNSNKAKKLLGWKSVLNINKTLKLTAEWYLANNNKENMKKFSLNQINAYTTLFNRFFKKK